MMMRQSVRLAWWSVLRHRRRSAFVVGAICFGVIALILASAFIEWIFWAARQGAIQSGLGHIQVVHKRHQERAAGDATRFLLSLSAPELQAMRAMPGVRTIAPRLSFSGLASRGELTLSFLGEGVDPERERDFTEISIIVEGDDLSGAARDGIIVGKGLAANLGVSVGERIVLVANTPGGGINAVEATVRGLFATVSKAYDDIALRVPLALAHDLVRTEGVHRWIIVLDDTDATDPVLEDLRARHGASDLAFIPWYRLADFYNKTVGLLSRQMAVVKIIITLVIVLVITNAMMTGVMERTSEIGTAMVIGTPQRGILLQFLVEGLVIGMLGGALGVGLGIGLAETISAIGIPMPPPPGQSRGFVAGMIVTVPIVGTAFAVAMLSALLAALYPAWKASRMNPVDALRHNH